MTIIAGTGGGYLPTKIVCRAGHLFEQFFSHAWGLPEGLARGLLVAGIDAHNSCIHNKIFVY